MDTQSVRRGACKALRPTSDSDVRADKPAKTEAILAGCARNLSVKDRLRLSSFTVQPNMSMTQAKSSEKRVDPM
ncbi:hypothetical protein GSI_09968 [Ganoderma sinense ZZ0214-1]|uniref:Uncharacterized protein n=1 Tax=Ganoderma sinense ZZ0214-1 TaxID=1077348 RepID=A0A2G8S2C9_9APHY|nr:hypothetical protein GSI_09968 [Ganoderma sinense ZZ0214-1]